MQPVRAFFVSELESGATVFYNIYCRYTAALRCFSGEKENCNNIYGGRKMSYFEEVKKNFEFGCMRLPMKDGEVDHEEFSRMVDYCIDAGFNYFDTAHGYLGGKSEKALRKCLVDRYPREEVHSYRQADGKLFQDRGGCAPLL